MNKNPAPLWCLFILFQINTFFLFSQISTWKTYTAKHEVRDILLSNSTVWAATSGGLFTYNLTDGLFNTFTTSEGLKTVDITALATDTNRLVWIGAANGYLHAYDPKWKTWRYVSDIYRDNNHGADKRINSLYVRSDTLYILSNIGVSLFSIPQMEFIDNYLHPLVKKAKAAAFFQGKLWIGTENGLAYTDLNNPNPSSAELWHLYSASSGLPSNIINALTVNGDSLYAATDNGLAIFNGISWSTVSGTTGLNIINVKLLPSECHECEKIFFITEEKLYSIADGIINTLASGFPTNLTSLADKTILGSSASGIMVLQSDGWKSKIPSGPLSNSFVGIAVDERGLFWSGTGTRAGRGFTSFDGTTWKPYTVPDDPRLGNNEYYKVSIGHNNTKWISSWGAGVAIVNDIGNIVNVLNTTNGLPPTIEPSYIVVGGVATDNNGVAWITNRTAGDSTAVVLFYPDSSIRKNVRMKMRDPLIVFTDVVIDFNGTKWFANFNRFEPIIPNGFYYYNENGTLPATNNGWGELTKSDGLTSNSIWSLAIDKQGELWVGTDQGINIIFDPGRPLSSIAIYHPLGDQVIQSILVDPLNRKWVATKQGVFLMSPDGTSITDRYTVQSTDGKLLDDDVTSIAINGNTGIIYFGTEKGLSTLTTTAITPKQSFSELKISPNPFFLSDSSNITVDNLIESSSLKILAIDGSLVREIRTDGGRVGFWNGRNEEGNLVSSGIYIVLAYSENGNVVAAGKIAVIR